MASVAKLKDLVDALISWCRDTEDGSLEECAQRLEVFFEDVDAHPGLKKALESPVTTVEEKVAVVRDLCASRGMPLAIGNFLAVTAEFGRLGTLFARRHEVVERLLSAGGTARAVVTTAQPVGAGQRQHIEEVINKLAGGARAKVEFTEDSEIIGGIVVKIGNSVYDDSVKMHLEKIRAALSKQP